MPVSFHKRHVAVGSRLNLSFGRLVTGKAGMKRWKRILRWSYWIEPRHTGNDAAALSLYTYPEIEIAGARPGI